VSREKRKVCPVMSNVDGTSDCIKSDCALWVVPEHRVVSPNVQFINKDKKGSCGLIN